MPDNNRSFSDDALSVDDILAQVRAMREAKQATIQEKEPEVEQLVKDATPTNNNKVKITKQFNVGKKKSPEHELKVGDFTGEYKVSDMSKDSKVNDFAQETKPFEPIKEEEIDFANEKLNRFLSGPQRNRENLKEKAKTQVDTLYNGGEETPPRSNVLSASEINSNDEQTVQINLDFLKNKKREAQISLPDVKKKNPIEQKPNGFVVKLDLEENEKTVSFDKIDIDKVKKSEPIIQSENTLVFDAPDEKLFAGSQTSAFDNILKKPKVGDDFVLSKRKKQKVTKRKIQEAQLEFVSNQVYSNDEYIEDYKSIDDAESIRLDLQTRGSRLNKKFSITLLFLILSLVVTLLPTFNLELISALSITQNVKAYLIANITILGIVSLSNISTIILGLVSLLKLKPSIDSAVSLSFIACLVQSVVGFNNTSLIESNTFGIYSTLCIFAVLFNLWGKKKMISRIARNFKLVATTSVKQGCFIASDEAAAKIASDDELGVPYVACSRSVINLHNFLNHSYCEDPADSISKIFAPIVLFVSVLIGLFAFTASDDKAAVFTAVSILSASLSIGIPITSIFATNSTLSKAAKNLREMGGIFTGYNAVDTFSETECVVIDSEELFPAGSIDLVSLKSVDPAAIESLILTTASLVITAGGPLSDVFDKIIDGRHKMLLKAQDVYYEDGLGICGLVNNENICVGNRTMMTNKGIDNLPSFEQEANLARNGNTTLYVSKNDELIGIFVVKYNDTDDEIGYYFEKLIDSGVEILIKTNDVNITPTLIERVFNVPSECVKIMDSSSVLEYEKVSAPRENGDCVLAHNNSVAAFMNGIAVAKNVRIRSILATTLQTIFVILGIGVIGFFVLTNNLNSVYLSPLYLFGFQVATSILSIIIPKFKKL